MTGVQTLDQLLAIDENAQDLLFREARTANRFTDEPVPDEQVQAIYDLVKWAPTSFNQQPLRLVLVRSTKAREQLVSRMMDSNQEKTRNAPLTAIVAADVDFHENLPTQFPVFPQAKDYFFGDEAVRIASATMNAALQVAYFVIGIRAAGLAAGPMSGFDTDGVNKDFFPEGRHRTLCVINIGRPAPNAWHDRLPRLEYDQVVSTV